MYLKKDLSTALRSSLRISRLLLKSAVIKEQDKYLHPGGMIIFEALSKITRIQFKKSGHRRTQRRCVIVFGRRVEGGF